MNTIFFKAPRWTASLACLFAFQMTARADETTWIEPAGGEWTTEAHWSEGIPGATTTAYLTNNFDAYVVRYNTSQEFLEEDATLVMDNPKADQTVTLEINRGMGAWAPENRPRIQTGPNAIVIAGTNTWTDRIYLYAPAGVTQEGTFISQYNGYLAINFDSSAAFAARVIIEDGGFFQPNGTVRFTGDARVTVEAGGRMAPTASCVFGFGVASVVVTNWGRIDFGNQSISIGYRLTNEDGFSEFHQKAGSLENNNVNHVIRVGYADRWGDSPGQSRLFVTGGGVTNLGRTAVGVNNRDNDGTRTTDGGVEMDGGEWLNHLSLLVGGFETGYTGAAGGNAGNYDTTWGYFKQTGGTFRILDDVLVANGPAQGTLTLSGGTFTVTNSTGDATLVVGAAVGDNVHLPGQGLLRLDGGHLRVDRLEALNGDGFSGIEFESGTLETGGTAVDNGGVLTVGDGIASAVLNLLGGTHAFADGIAFNANAALKIGPENTIGTAEIEGDLALHDDARLVWCFAEGAHDFVTVDGAVHLPDSAIVDLVSLDASQPEVVPVMSATGGFTGSTQNWPPIEWNGSLFRAVVEGDTLVVRQPRGTIILLH